MEKFNNFSIVTDNGIEFDHQKMIKYCLDKKTYKFLSLLINRNETSIKCPSSVLINTTKINLLTNYFNKFSFPLTVRLDYSTFPKKKSIGGMRINSISDLIKINEFNIRNNCYTLVHPYFNRLKNDLNVGILLLPSEKKVIFEYLGAGFDAGDLRLGKINPHEIKIYNQMNCQVKQIKLCTREEYIQSKTLRLEQIKKLSNYQNYVNINQKLTDNIDALDNTNGYCNYKYYLPNKYSRVETIIEKHLFQFSHSLLNRVNKLPKSDSYVASLSMVDNELLLWDIYGKWYER